MKKILMLSQSPFPPDIRLEKEIKSLSESGYQVQVVCNQYDKTKKPKFKYCTIKRVRALFNSYTMNRITNFPIFLNPRYLAEVYKSVVRFKPNYLHAHDLPMMPIAILYGKIFRLPVIFDMHENYPEALKYFEKKGILNFIFKNYYLAKILEKICLKFSDKIIVVVDENKHRLTRMGVKSKNIHVVSNTVDINTFTKKISLINSIQINNENRNVILYTGTISPDRGLLTAIKSAYHFDDLEINPIIFLIGEGSYKKFLVSYVENNNLLHYIRFLDWPGHEKIPLYIEKASVCMIPQPNNDFINTTIPHKLFEYMAMEKPVIVSDALPLERIVKETNSGLVFKSGNALDFANKIDELLSSKILLGLNGLKAVKEKYNWQVDAKVLVDMYIDLNKRLN